MARRLGGLQLSRRSIRRRLESTSVLGLEEELNKNGMFVHHLNMLKYENINEPMRAVTKIRYKNAGAESTLFSEPGDLLRIAFDSNVSAITPGQSAVFYEGNDVIGGGHIVSAFQQ